MEYIELSKERLEEVDKKLFNIIKEQYEYDCVIFIAKGSFYIGKDIANFNNVPLLEIFATRKGNKLKNIIRPIIKIIPKSIKKKLREKEINSNFHNTNNERQVSFNDKQWKKCLKSKNILLVDDSVDTGNTITSVKKYINEYFPKANLKITALNVMSKSIENCTIDYYLFKDTMLNGPWSNDSKYYNQFIDDYNKWHENNIL